MAKMVYVAHEVSGDVQGNVKKILEICRKYHTRDVIPFAPYLLALQYLDDSLSEERELGILANAEFFKRGAIDEVGVFGRKVTKGVFGELGLASQFGVPIKSYDEQNSVEVEYAIRGIEKGIGLVPYLMAERTLSKQRTLFFRRDGGNTPGAEDIVLIESETRRDKKTGKDITRFDPVVINYDELYEGWRLVDERCRNMQPAEQTAARNKFYDAVAQFYEKRKPIPLEAALSFLN